MANTGRDRKKVNVRGINLFRSRVSGDVSFSELCKMYLVLKALDGDRIAQELFDATGTIVHDLDGVQIYPPVDE
jgi:hypothetical protein